MADLTTLRNDLADALGAAGRVVYAFPNETITPPALVLVPGAPYITPVAIGGPNNRIEVRFELTAVVAAQDNQAALKALETLILDVFDVLPNGIGIDTWRMPTIEEVNGAKRLTSSINIVVTTSN